MTRSGSPSRSPTSTCYAGDDACSASDAEQPASSTQASAFRWRKRAARFAEAAQLVTTALREEVFEWSGEFYKIPTMSIRPRPMSNPERRFYASSVSPELAEIMAKLGFGMMVIMQNEWQKAAADIKSFREIAISVGHTPTPPVILTNVSCAPSRAEAEERAAQFLGAKWDSIDAHYHFSDGHLANVKGYEFLRQDGQDLRQVERPGRAQQDDGLLCQYSDRRHAG